MQEPTPAPDGSGPDGQVADAVKGNWVDTLAPAFSRPWLRLSRADRPIGTWLLLIPCWWGLVLSILHDGVMSLHDLWIAAGCAIGAWLMRGAGCTWNDITDRNIDGAVERTRSRPIPSGQVSVRGAVIWMCAQSLAAFGILLSFNTAAIVLGILALVPVAIYPFAKRFTWWPQAFLGVAFNWGALLAWTAHSGRLEAPAVVLFMAGIAWTLHYDTIYAHQDKDDDALIGLKSTARLFDEATVPILCGFSAIAVVCAGVAAAIALQGLSLIIALIGVALYAAHMARQLWRLDIDDPQLCLELFRENRDTGLILFASFLAAGLF